MSLTWLDWLFLAVLTMSMLAGFMRGLVREALGLGAWVVALLVSRMFAPQVADMLSGFIDHPDARLVLAFILVIFVVVILCGMLIRAMHAAVEWVGMGFFNRLAGAGFGVLRGGAILVLATVLITLTPLAQLQAWQRAELRPSFEGLRDWAVSRVAAWQQHDPQTAEELRTLSLPIDIGGERSGEESVDIPVDYSSEREAR